MSCHCRTVKIHAEVLPTGNTCITEYEGEGDLRVETRSYYLTGDVSTALQHHARFSQEERGGGEETRVIRIHPPFKFV